MSVLDDRPTAAATSFTEAFTSALRGAPTTVLHAGLTGATGRHLSGRA